MHFPVRDSLYLNSSKFARGRSVHGIVIFESFMIYPDGANDSIPEANFTDPDRPNASEYCR